MMKFAALQGVANDTIQRQASGDNQPVSKRLIREMEFVGRRNPPSDTSL
jgi:hypothetical protein